MRFTKAIEAAFWIGAVGATACVWVPSAWATLIPQAWLLLMSLAVGLRTASPPTWLPLSLGLTGVAAAIQAWSVSTSPAASVVEAVQWWAITGVVYIVAATSIKHHARSIIAWAGVLITIVALVHFFGSGGRFFWIWPATEPQVFAPFRSRNNFASFVLLVIPVVLWQAAREVRRRWFWIAAAALLAGAAIASGSRAGATLALVEVFACTCMLPVQSRRAWVATSLLIAVSVAVPVLGWDLLASKMGDSDPLRHRREIAQATLAMVQARPLWGFGAGSFSAAYPAFANFDSGHFVNFAHNDWLEYAADHGVVLFGGQALLLVLVAARGIQAGWGIGIAAVLIHALVDYPLQRFGVSIWFWILAALAVSQAPRARPDTATRHNHFRHEPNAGCHCF